MRRLLGTALLLMLFSAGMWFAWLGWDHEYYLVDGVAQGPYRAWQVVGCGAAIAAASVLAYLRVRDVIAIFVLAAAAVVGFAVPWSWDASSDETGMWVVGLFMLLVGGGAGPGHGAGGDARSREARRLAHGRAGRVCGDHSTGRPRLPGGRRGSPRGGHLGVLRSLAPGAPSPSSLSTDRGPATELVGHDPVVGRERGGRHRVG